MKEAEREKTTAELAVWQQRQRREAEEAAQLTVQHQREEQKQLKAKANRKVEGCVGGRKVEPGKSFSL